MACAGRFLVGSCAGAASLYVPRYLSEVSPIAIRGGISTLNQVGFAAWDVRGGLVGCWCGVLVVIASLCGKGAEGGGVDFAATISSPSHLQICILPQARDLRPQCASIFSKKQILTRSTHSLLHIVCTHIPDLQACNTPTPPPLNPACHSTPLSTMKGRLV